MITLRNARLGIILTTAVLLTAALAQAQCASPPTSTFPSHITICPRGDIPVIGSVRDANGNPCSGTSMAMTFHPPVVSTVFPTPGYSFPTARTVTRPNGDVAWWPQIGGCGMNGTVSYDEVATGYVIGQSVTVNSPDIDGNGRVDLSDAVQLVTAFGGPYDPCVDFNLDGVVDLSDVVLFRAHFGH